MGDELELLVIWQQMDDFARNQVLWLARHLNDRECECCQAPSGDPARIEDFLDPE